MWTRLLVTSLFIAALMVLLPRAALASEPVTEKFTRYGIDIWVTIIPRGHDISAQERAEKPWTEWGNGTSDIYAFSFHRPNNLLLIFEFSPQHNVLQVGKDQQRCTDGMEQPNGVPEARIYIDDLGRKPLVYTMQGETLHVATKAAPKQPLLPYLTICPENGEWYDGEKVNYQARIFLDGLMPSGGDKKAATDGVIDWKIRAGTDEAGNPLWETSRLVNDPHPDWGYPRIGLRQRMKDGPTFDAEKDIAPIFLSAFPYFDIGLGKLPPSATDPLLRGAEINWFEINPRPLYYDLTTAQLGLQGFVGSQNAGMYYSNSLLYPPAVNFETPFTFYGFTGSRYPQLVVRGGYFPAGSAGALVDSSSFRYSWRTTNDRLWRYSLDVAGTYAYTQEIKIGDETFLCIPPDTVPDWVVTKEWPLATFVESIEGYRGSEGIYFYTAQARENWAWLDGSAEHHAEHLDTPFLVTSALTLTKGSDLGIPPRFRGEFNAAYFHKPEMSFSPIDKRLHLMYPQLGFWNLGEGRVLRTHNLNKDAYVDGWTREIVPPQDIPLPDEEEGEHHGPAEIPLPKILPGEIEEALYALNGYLLYSGPTGTELRKAAYELSSFQVQPPHDKASWQAFVKAIKPHEGVERDPENLKSWFDAFPGQTRLTSPGKLWAVRATPNGFRFAVELQPGFDLQGIPGTAGLQPRNYAVIVDTHGTIAIEPLTPPVLHASLRVQKDLLALEPGAIQFILRNDGQEDMLRATFELSTSLSPQKSAIALSRTVDLLAGEPLTLTMQWPPAQPQEPWMVYAGEWTMTPQIVWPDGEKREILAALPLTVQPSKPVSSKEMLEGSISPRVLPFIILTLLSFATIAAIIFWHQLGGIQEEHDDDAEID